MEVTHLMSIHNLLSGDSVMVPNHRRGAGRGALVPAWEAQSPKCSAYTEDLRGDFLREDVFSAVAAFLHLQPQHVIICVARSW